jgi:serine/threonine protein kinase
MEEEEEKEKENRPTTITVNNVVYTIGKQVGGGRFGEVHVLNNNNNMAMFAAKILRDQTSLDRELRMIKMLNRPSPHIIEFIQCNYDQRIIVMKFAEMTLHEMLNICRNSIFPAELIPTLRQHLTSALQHIHLLNIIHADVKPSNILYNEGRFMLCDFGNAFDIKKFPRGHAFCTMFYRSVELLKEDADDVFSSQSIHCISIDYWSLGVVLLECMMPRAYIGQTGPFGFTRDQGVISDWWCVDKDKRAAQNVFNKMDAVFRQVFLTSREKLKLPGSSALPSLAYKTNKYTGIKFIV